MPSALASWSANLSVANDYVFRGISNSAHRPALQGGVDYVHASGVYAGSWASNVDFNDGGQARSEVDVYAGMTGSVHGLDWDASILSFNYPGAPRALKYASWKYRLDVRHAMQGATVGMYLDAYHDYFGSGPASYLEGMLLLPLSDGVTLDMRLGRQRLTDNSLLGLPDYTWRSVSLQMRLRDWEFRLGWQSSGVSRQECFGGQNWCGNLTTLQATRYFRLLE